MRSQVAGRRGERDTAPLAVLRPLFGDLTWSQDRFNTELDELVATYKDTKIDIAEGTLARSTVLPDGQVRVTVERPYIDLSVMSLVQKTRIILVEVTDRARHASPSEPVWR